MKEQQNGSGRQFNCSFPALELPSKGYSLEADIVTGWRPKMKIIGPVPLNFDSHLLDEIIDELTSFGRKAKERVIYLGYRYNSSFKLQQEIKKNYIYKHESIINTNFSHLAAYFRKFHNNFKSNNSRLFKGMNPTIKSSDQLTFDCNFQSGNLDAAIKVSNQCQYDIFMRVDTNTRGHVQWFNFTVKNNHKSKIKINIVNFRKHKTLYDRGMKPYLCSSYLQKQKNVGWHQGGNQVKYQIKKLRYDFLSEKYNVEYLSFNCLSFEYDFLEVNQVVQFAYCPPFTYSDNEEMISNLMKKTELNKSQVLSSKMTLFEGTSHSTKEINQIENQEDIIKEESLCDSLGGLQLKLLTITDPAVPNHQKKCIFAQARIHPGETCGSYMVKGFLEFIVGNSEMAKMLRKNIVFKVIPMVNPDGVVVGNYRTSLCGKDLNRMFKIQENLMLIPEVKAIKNLVLKLKSEFKSRLTIFLDFHGHSMKKNVFMYGPEYEIWETNYYRTRIYPKLISQRTQIFRYYSCLFRIADFKRTTARAIILKTIPHCYTIEASAAFYYSVEEKKDIQFNPLLWELVGRKIGQSICDYLDLLEEEETLKFQRKNKLKEERNKEKMSKNKSRTHNPLRNDGNYNHSQKRDKLSRSKNEKKLKNSNNISSFQDQSEFLGISTALDEDTSNGPVISNKVRQFIEGIKNQEFARSKCMNLEEPNDSDKFSEGGSDSEPPEDDMDEKELEKMHHQIQYAWKQFKDVFANKNREDSEFDHLQFKPKKNNRLVITGNKELEMIASLRKKVESSDQTQKKDELKKSKNYRKNIWSKIGGEIQQISYNKKTKQQFEVKMIEEEFWDDNLMKKDFSKEKQMHEKTKSNLLPFLNQKAQIFRRRDSSKSKLKEESLLKSEQEPKINNISIFPMSCPPQGNIIYFSPRKKRNFHRLMDE